MGARLGRASSGALTHSSGKSAAAVVLMSCQVVRTWRSCNRQYDPLSMCIFMLCMGKRHSRI